MRREVVRNRGYVGIDLRRLLICQWNGLRVVTLVLAGTHKEKQRQGKEDEAAVIVRTIGDTDCYDCFSCRKRNDR